MSFSSITDENTVNILPMYNKLVKINNRIQMRDKWSRFAQLTYKKNRTKVTNKLIQYEKTLVLYKQKKKKRFFEKWKILKKWVDFFIKLKNKRRYEIFSNYKESQKHISSQKKRIIWKKLSQKLINRNKFTYLIDDLSSLFKYRTMKRCFLFWVEKLSYSQSILRQKWKYLMARRLHREVILRIYNVQSIPHTRFIWRDFIDRILRQYYLNNLEIARNSELIRQNWIFLFEKTVHEQNLKKLYRVKSKLKTRAVWKYFLTSLMVKFLRSIFISHQTQYELKRKKKAAIRKKWENLFCAFRVYSRQESIQSIRRFLKIRSTWRNFVRKVYFNSLRNSLIEGLAKVNYKKEQIRLKLLLQSTFKQWFCYSVSEIKLKEVYDEAFSIFVPTFRENSARLIQRIFRLHLKHQKDIHDMIFNNLTFDSFTQSFLFKSSKHFLTPVVLPKKIWTPLVDLISLNEAKNNYNYNFFNSEKKSIDQIFNLDLFPEQPKLHFFSTDKNFPTPQIELDFDYLNFNDFDINIPSNIYLFKKENCPKFTEKRIHEDVIQFLQVEPEFELLLNSKDDRFRFNCLKKSDIIEKVLQNETDFSIEDAFESSFDLELLINHHNHLIEYEAFKQIPQTEAKFGITNQISEDYIELIHEEIENERFQQFLSEINLNSFLNIIHHYKTFCSQFQHVKKQQKKRVLSLTFSVDDRLIKKKKFGSNNLFVSKYALFQTGIDLLFNEQYFIRGFFFTPKISRFCAVDSMIDRQSFSDVLPVNYLNSNLSESNCHFHICNPVTSTINEKTLNGQERSIYILSRELELNEIEYEPQIDLNVLSFYCQKRSKQSKESLQDEFLNSYMNEFEEEEIQMDLIDFNQNLSLSSINISIEKRPCDVISFYTNQTIDTSILFLQDFQINFESPLSTFEIKDDKSFLKISQLNYISNQIILDVLNEMPIVSNLPSSQTIREITNDFFSIVPLSPPGLSQKVRRLEFLNSKDPVSLVGRKNVEIQVNSLFNEIQFPIVPNDVGQNFNVDFDVNFNELMDGISKQYNVDNLEQMEANDERAYINQEVIDDLINSSQQSILDKIPLNSNLPQNETLIEISKDFDIFQEEIDFFSSFGLNNESLLNYTIIDDRMFYDDEFNDQIALNILSEINDKNELPIILNVPNDDDIKLIADEFYDFCNINTKVPLSPIKRIEMKEDKSLISNQEAFNEFSSLIDSIDFPIVSNHPLDNTVDEIAAIFYDASDIICYFSGFENIIPLILYEMKDDLSFSSHFISDRICNEILSNEIELPIILNDIDSDKIEQITDSLTENIDNSMIDFILLQNKSFNFCFNFQIKEDRCFINNDLIDTLTMNMFDSIFEKEAILCSNLPEIEAINEIANDFFYYDVENISNLSISPLSNMELKDQRIYVNDNIVDGISMNMINSIFLEEKIFDSNLPKEETINEIASSFVDINVDPFSITDISSLLNIRLKDQKLYINRNVIAEITTNIFTSIFESHNILCSNLPKESTITEIVEDFIDSDIDSISNFSISSLSNIEIKDQRIYVNNNIVDEIISNILESIFNSEKEILCSNLPDNETINEIADEFIDSNVDSFSNINLSSLLNIQLKDQILYINKNIIENIYTNIFESIFSEENILYLNSPEDEAIDEIVYQFNDTNVNQFSIIDLSSLMNFNLKDDQSFIKTQVLDSLNAKILFDELNSIPIISNQVNFELISEIISVPEFHDSFSDLGEISKSSLTFPIERFEIKDDKYFCSWNDVDEITKSIMLEDIPIIMNDFTENDVVHFFDFIDFNDVLKNVVINEFDKKIIRFNRKDDRSFVKNEEVEALYFNIFFDAIDTCPLSKNIPSLESINEISLLEFNELTDVDMFFENSSFMNLERFESKESKSFFSNENADSFCLSIFNSIQLPLIENDVDSSMVNEITNFIIRKNKVFDLNFKSSFESQISSILEISPYERPIKIDTKVVKNICEVELKFVFRQYLPIIPNVIQNNDVDKILKSINLFDAFAYLPKIPVNPIKNLTKKEEIILIDDFELCESLILKILYEQILPIIPIRKKGKLMTENNFTPTELLVEDDDYNE